MDLVEKARLQREEVLDEIEEVEIVKPKPKKKPPKKKVPAKKKPTKKKPTKTKSEKDNEMFNESVEVEVIESKPEIIIEPEIEPEPKQTYAIQEYKPMETLPSKAEVKRHLEMYRYVKNEIVDSSDFITFNKREFMKKSGWRKFVKAFNISIELIEKRIFKDEFDDDIHCSVRVRAFLPNGQSIEGYAIKSKSEFWSEKFDNWGNYTRHNLETTAWTRAVNRAISDLVGFGEVSAEEIDRSGSDGDNMF